MNLEPISKMNDDGEATVLVMLIPPFWGGRSVHVSTGRWFPLAYNNLIRYEFRTV